MTTSFTTSPTSLINLAEDTLARARESTSNTSAIELVKRYLNQGLHDVHIQNNWWWAERRDRINTHAEYTTGTVSIALANRTTVTGSSTAWNTAVTGMGFNNVRAGGKMVFSGSSDVYTVSSVASDTSLTLVESYVGTSALSGATYRYYEDEYALASDFWRVADIRDFGADWPIEVLSRQEFYRRYVRNSTAARPTVCTVIDLAPSSSTARQPRVLFHTPPDIIYTIPYRYITTNLAVSSAGAAQVNMSADADEPIIPLRYRHVLIYYALREWYRDRKDDARSQEAGAMYTELLVRMANDSIPERDHPRLKPRRGQYLAGITGNLSRTRRYSTGSAFDELRD